MKRLPFTTFSIPVPEIRRGYYSAVYFWREKRILEREKKKTKALIQVFNKVDGSVVSGMDEVLAILRLGTGHWKNYSKMYPLFDQYIELKAELRSANVKNDFQEIERITSIICEIRHELNNLWEDTHEELRIFALEDGESIVPFEAVLTIEGRASEFAHLESLYLGVLGRGTRVATNTHRLVCSARGKPVLFFADRYDRWDNQVSDGFSAMKSGASGVATDAMGKWWGIGGFGTIPHALIALFDGNTVEATLAFARQYPNVKTIALVDFHNHAIQTSLEVARAFSEAKQELWGVRVDTSDTMVDQSIIPIMGTFRPTGVCIPLVEKLRMALDEHGFSSVRIVVSGGFTPQKIEEFEEKKVPVDAYGVGSALLEGRFDYTADVVMVNSKPMSKVGRAYQPSHKLKLFDWLEIAPNNEKNKKNEETKVIPIQTRI